VDDVIPAPAQRHKLQEQSVWEMYVSAYTFQSVYVSAYGRFSQCMCQHMDVSVSVRVSIWTFQSVYVSAYGRFSQYMDVCAMHIRIALSYRA
jgi:hypothetical protein